MIKMVLKRRYENGKVVEIEDPEKFFNTQFKTPGQKVKKGVSYDKNKTRAIKMAGDSHRLEDSAVKEIVRNLRARGYKPVKNHGSPFAQRGRADIEVLIPFAMLPYGVLFAIEVKRDRAKTNREQQKLRLKNIADAGGVGLIAADWPTVERAIERTRLEILRFFKQKVREQKNGNTC